jgi:LppP/LprE lipoprotein
VSRPRLNGATSPPIAGALVVTATAVALIGCGGSTKTVTEEIHTVTQPATTPSAPSNPPPQQKQQGQTPPSTDEAQSYAGRTYVVQSQLGKRVFKLAGPVQTITADDGSVISAFPVVLADSGDGTGQAVLLFRGSQFLGWATNQMAFRLTVGSSGSDIAVHYGDYQGSDPTCCPSSTKTVDYSWNGSRVVADGDPPLIYGKPGDQLHLGG